MQGFELDAFMLYESGDKTTTAGYIQRLEALCYINWKHKGRAHRQNVYDITVRHLQTEKAELQDLRGLLRASIAVLARILTSQIPLNHHVGPCSPDAVLRAKPFPARSFGGPGETSVYNHALPIVSSSAGT